MQNVHISDFLALCTVRIEAATPTGLSSGTGFFYDFGLENKFVAPTIVTNKHVVENSSYVNIYLSLTSDGGKNYRVQKINLGNCWRDFIKHPDVDLAALPIAPFLTDFEEKSIIVRRAPLNCNLIPTDIEFGDFLTIEDVTMVGYPNSIWDDVNNLPVIRRGITAVHPNTNWQGRPEFIIDIAAFPGSSGSPVFIYNPSDYTLRDGSTVFTGGRLKLLGILYAGTQHKADGSIEVISIPTKDVPISRMYIPNNIGIVVNSRCLKWFEKYIRDLVVLGNLR